jgi:hypothetical protein
MARPNDTSPEAEQVLREAYRRMPFAQKWRLMGEMYHTGKVLHAAGFRQRNPGATDEAVHEAWLIAALGEALAREVTGFSPANAPNRAATVRERCRPPLPDGRGSAASTMLVPGGRQGVAPNDESVKALREVLAALDRLGIAYALGGSWASSLLGKMRFTHDADVAVEPFPGKEADFCAAFGDDYYVSLDAVRDAVRRRSSFNVIHLPSGFKVDLFVRKDRPFDQSVLARRQPRELAEGAGQAVMMVSPEDVILLKLEWYRLGGEASEQQWRDVLGVFEVQAGKLDQAYLDRWAAHLNVTDLLQRARQESGI